MTQEIDSRSLCWSYDVLALILAGGRGSRLKEMTDHRCKPFVPVGKLRLIDFALANIVNSQIIRRAYVLTQYKQQGVIKHLAEFNTESPFWGSFVRALPAQQQQGEDWYLGNANAVYQNHQLIRRDPASKIVILAADHVYKMDIRQFLSHHVRQEAAITVCGRYVPVEQAASNFGVISIGKDGAIKGFVEKPEHPSEAPGRPGMCFASMGIYMADKDVLMRLLEVDHVDELSDHDFGKNIIPLAIEQGARVIPYDHQENIIPGEREFVDGEERPVNYWVDAGTLDAYWDMMMDLVSTKPQLNLYNDDWPIRTVQDYQQMYKIISPHEASDSNCAPHYMAAGGGIFTDAKRLYMSVFGRGVRIQQDVVAEYSVVLDCAVLEPGARINKTILEEGVVVPAGVEIGYDIARDQERGIRVTEGGVRLVTMKAKLTP